MHPAAAREPHAAGKAVSAMKYARRGTFISFLLFATSTLAQEARAPQLSLSLRRNAPASAVDVLTEQQTCMGHTITPVGWHDPSNALAMMTSPTALHDAQELHSIVLDGLVSVRFTLESVRLFVLGVPSQPGRTLSTEDGQLAWRPRWPFC
jgi:hypothetical protein